MSPVLIFMTLSKKRWRTEKVVIPIAVAAIAGVAAVLVSLKRGKASEPINQTGKNNLAIQQGTNSSVTIAGSFNQTTTINNNYERSTSFNAPDGRIRQSSDLELTGFQTRHPNTTVTVETESGNFARRQVGLFIGSILQEKKIGRFRDSMNVGPHPLAPITIFFAPGEQGPAMDFNMAFLRYFIKGSTSFQTDPRLSKGSVRVYLFGTPTFSTNGFVKFE